MEMWKTLRSAFPTFPQGLPRETKRKSTQDNSNDKSNDNDHRIALHRLHSLTSTNPMVDPLTHEPPRAHAK